MRWGPWNWVVAITGSYIGGLIVLCLVSGFIDMDGHDPLEEPIRSFVYQSLRTAGPALWVAFLASLVLFGLATIRLLSLHPGRRVVAPRREVAK